MFFKKKVPDEEIVKKTRLRKEPEDDHEWDKKKISVGLIILAIGLIGFMEVKDRFFSDSDVLGSNRINRSEIKKPDVKAPKIDLQSELGISVDEIKNNINNLDAREVASSSPQIQKVLKDIEGIKDLPTNEAKEACMKICSGI